MFSKHNRKWCSYFFLIFDRWLNERISFVMGHWNLIDIQTEMRKWKIWQIWLIAHSEILLKDIGFTIMKISSQVRSFLSLEVVCKVWKSHDNIITWIRPLRGCDKSIHSLKFLQHQHRCYSKLIGLLVCDVRGILSTPTVPPAANKSMFLLLQLHIHSFTTQLRLQCIKN